MQEHADDPGVYIRSMAGRGHLGGLSAAAPRVAEVLDGAGFDVILIETVGVGQAEVEIMHHAHSTVVVVTPGWGDSIQVGKAGLMEIGDVFAVNKADLPGAVRARRDLETMLAMGPRPGPGRPRWWRPRPCPGWEWTVCGRPWKTTPPTWRETSDNPKPERDARPVPRPDAKHMNDQG